MTESGKRVGPSELASSLIKLHSLGRLALFTDIDGTLSPIASTPNEALKSRIAL